MKGGIMLLVVLLSAAPAWAEELYLLHFKDIAIQGKERVSSIRLDVTGATISGIRTIPGGWDIGIEVEPLWHVALSGQIVVGAAATEVDAWNDTVILRVDGPVDAVSIDGHLGVTEDFDAQRPIPLNAGNTSLVRLKR